jgi:hypothetical protein
MQHTSQPLAPLVAALAADLRAMAHRHAGARLPAAVMHALILALLAGMLARLEAMIRLWQSGRLPPATPPAAHPPFSHHRALRLLATRQSYAHPDSARPDSARAETMRQDSAGPSSLHTIPPAPLAQQKALSPWGLEPRSGSRVGEG